QKFRSRLAMDLRSPGVPVPGTPVHHCTIHAQRPSRLSRPLRRKGVFGAVAFFGAQKAHGQTARRAAELPEALRRLGASEAVMVSPLGEAWRGDTRLDLGSLESDSEPKVALAALLPAQLAPAQLLSLVRAACRVLAPGGQMYVASRWGCNGPLRHLLASKELNLQVCIRPPEGDEVWTYVCTKGLSHAVPSGSVQVLLEA
ncbi:unnamed protein product, partial [Effrenium voratum]